MRNKSLSFFGFRYFILATYFLASACKARIYSFVIIYLGFQRCPNVSLFTAGSLGRLEASEKSDLDIFATCNETNGITRLNEIKLFAKILKVNETLNFPELSNDGEFLKIFNITKHNLELGSPQDDSQNWFTARMLLLLESKCLTANATHQQHIREILKIYFRDSDNHPFKPFFILNDILRYWRTICLNYEETRHNNSRSWKKKNLNLRFSRKLTVFGTVLPLVVNQETLMEDVFKLTQLTPLERLASGLDVLKNADDLVNKFNSFLNHYDYFLIIKEKGNIEKLSQDEKSELDKKSDAFSRFLSDALMHESIPDEMKNFLII